MLLASGACVNASNSLHSTALMMAAFIDNARIVEVRTMGITSLDPNSTHVLPQWCMLYLLSSLGSHQTLLWLLRKVLLAAGANCDAKNNDGWTALMMAARFGHLEVVQVRTSPKHNSSYSLALFLMLHISILL